MKLAFNHVGMSVSDLDAAITFYGAVLGMEVVVQDRFGGPAYAEIFALPGATGRAALIRGGGFQIEMFEFETPAPAAPDRSRPVNGIGITHFCIDVTDIAALFDRLTARGVVTHGPPVDFAGQALAVYARDPDGNVIEFRQVGRSA